jgi:hypothetical protein
MKLNVIGVKRIKGTSSKTGNVFDMCRLFALVPITSQGGKTLIQGHGFELAEMELDPAALVSFSKLSFPVDLELQTDTRPYMGKLESVVTGFFPIQASAPKAVNG